MVAGMDRDHERLLEIALAAAGEAAAAIMAVYAQPLAVREKGDRSPVTHADEAAEQVIVARLTAAAPNIPVIAEELAERSGLPTTAPPRFWLVDPLDGTKEFIAKNGEFTVNIALIEDGRPVLGVVHAPALAASYWAAGPRTAMRQHGKEPPQPIAARPVPARGPVVVHSRSHLDEEALAAFLRSLDAPERCISGSSIKFCRIAAGEADLYPRFGTTMEWDTAAGQAVLEAAGGRVLTADGMPLRYGKPGFRNPDFIARGSD